MATWSAVKAQWEATDPFAERLRADAAARDRQLLHCERRFREHRASMLARRFEMLRLIREGDMLNAGIEQAHMKDATRKALFWRTACRDAGTYTHLLRCHAEALRRALPGRPVLMAAE